MRLYQHPLQHLFVATTVVAALSLSSAAHAQVSSPFVPTAIGQLGSGPKATPFSVQAFPLARFSGTDDKLHVSGSTDGFAAALEYGEVIGSKDNSFKVGGFYWGKSGTYLGELHGKYYFSRSFGVQVGALKAKNYSSVDEDLFALYNLSSDTLSPTMKNRWSVQFGAGGYHYGVGSETKFSGFVQGAIEIVTNVTLDASYWRIQTPTGHFDRDLVGVGYRF